MSIRMSVVGAFALTLVGAITGATLSTFDGAQVDPEPAEGSQGTSSAGPGSRRLVTQAEYERWQTELSNWGRWGKDDELGTLNLITPAKRKQAVALVKDGVTVSLASDAATEKGVDVPCPVEWAMVTASQSGATDRIAYPCIHGAGATHLDSFALYLNHEERDRHPGGSV